ncbi:MAG: hypothetical protein KA066_00860 [Candidatus Pacebacteria bacterium]|nr:hypothetical protein [Candidatus Paceibacterota bacterium]
MKVVLGILVVLVLALGVWLSLRLGQTAPGTVATTTPVAQVPAGWAEFSSAQFSIQYPQGYTPDDRYTYTGLGPTSTIMGVKFTIDPRVASGTNLAADSYVSVEPLPGAINSCSAEIYLSDAHPAGFQDVGGRRYSVATSTGAGAGNRYEEVVFATPITQGCIAVRYMVHYGVLENYPEGAVQAFDRAALFSQFDAIRRTLVLK